MRIFKFFITKFRDVPLKQKLFFCIILFIVLPLLITGIIINSRFVELFSKKEFETRLSILKQSNQYFDNIIEEIEEMSLKAIPNQDIQNYLNILDKTGIQDEDTMVNTFRWLRSEISASNYMDSVSLSSRDKILLQTENMSFKAEESAFWETAYHLEGKGFWTHAYLPDTYIENEEYVVSFYRVINDINKIGNFLAMLRISVLEKTLNELCMDINSYNDGDTTIINDEGMVISSTQRTLLGSDMGEYTYVNNVLRNQEGHFVDRIDGKDKVILYYTIDEIGWHVIQIIPKNAVLSFKNTINAIVYIAILLCLLFGILFSIVQNKFVLKPLNRLLEDMRKLEKGDFDIGHTIESNDEIGKISSGVVDIVNQLKELINSVYISKIKQREAELMALEEQINPHFLYNTLDSIHWMAVKKKDYDVSDQIEALSDMFKHVLNRGQDTGTIKAELDFIENYIFIQKSKFGSRIDFKTEVDKQLYDYEIPKLILQPLVENSFYHGFEKKIGKGEIFLIIEREGNDIRISVIDNGTGTDEKKVIQMLGEENKDNHKIYALKNIVDRIKIKYGEGYGLEFFSEEGKGTRVEVLIPAINGK